MKKRLLAFVSNPFLSVATLAVIIGGAANIALAAVISSPTLVTNAGDLDAKLFCPIIDIMFWVLISVSIIMVLWAAFLYVTAEGEAEKPSQARKMVLYAAIGIVIALLAKGVPSLVADLFGQSSGAFLLNC
jgi:hypothetical protein